MAHVISSVPEPPPLTPEQAELIVLTKAPPGGCFIIPVGQQMQPALVQMAFERLLMGELVRLLDLNFHPVQVAINKTGLVPCRFFRLTDEGVRRLAVLRGTAKLDG